MYRMLDGSRPRSSETQSSPGQARDPAPRRAVKAGCLPSAWLLHLLVTSIDTAATLSIVNSSREFTASRSRCPWSCSKRVQPRMSREPLFTESLPKSMDTPVGPIDSVFGEAVANQTERGNRNQL